MGDSWDADDFEPVNPLASAAPDTSRWVDEDKEEPAKASWDDEDEPAKKPEKKTKAPAKKGKAAAAPAAPAAEVDPEQEKARRKAQIESADFANMQDMFGEIGKDNLIDLNNPKDEKDFEALSDVLATKLVPMGKSYYYKTFVKNLIRKISVNLSKDELKDLAASITVMVNAKIQAEKPKKKTKAAATTKKSVNVRSDDLDDYGDIVGDGGADDFM
eukprot:TRINITY_DN616_c0_g1_i1.p1 TRINITY_DN616_c0_g1~~TRINITY_DN616_c0_g1_i1.p1  ORF type:complete len:251 (+),score=73.78 TRINITY_DN616_c0_g1_i1:107-754(+)